MATFFLRSSVSLISLIGSFVGKNRIWLGESNNSGIRNISLKKQKQKTKKKRFFLSCVFFGD